MLKETYQEFLTLINEHRKVTGRASTNNELHHMTYKTMREKYKGIAAQLIEQARTIAWKTRKQAIQRNARSDLTKDCFPCPKLKEETRYHL
jgi:hypothetical protein